MESKQIERLLEKYLNAETSVREEEQLREYFSSDKVAPNLQEYVPMFSYFSLSKGESFTGTVAYKDEKRKVYSWIAVAASIMILFGIVTHQTEAQDDYGTYDDPELAMQKTKEALEMLSFYMNTGTEDLGYLQEFNQTKEKIIK